MSIFERGPSYEKIERWSYTAICISEWLNRRLSGDKQKVPEGVFLSVVEFLRTVIDAAKDSVDHPKHLADWGTYHSIRRFLELGPDPTAEGDAKCLEKHLAVIEAVQNGTPDTPIIAEDLTVTRDFFVRLHKAGESERYATMMRQAHHGFDDDFDE